MEHTNKVIIVGRVTWGIQIDEIAKKAGGTFKKCAFGIATNEKWEVPNGEEEKPMFVTCELYERMAREAMDHVSKGTQVTVEGRLEFQSWKDKKTGEMRGKHVIKVEKFIYDKVESPQEIDYGI